MPDYFEKLDLSIEAIDQLDQLRILCHYLIEQGYVKKTGNKHIKPIPLFNKNSATYVPIESIDAVTGNKFLKGSSLTAPTATKLMSWLQSHFSWAFLTPVVSSSASSWSTLVDTKAYRHSFMHFSLVGDMGNNLIDCEALRQASYRGLDMIPINQNWHLSLQGQASEHFMVILQSLDKTTQIAPLMPIEFEHFRAVMPEHATTLRYPSRLSLSFDKEDGLGWRRCIAIKTPFLPIQSKTIDEDLTLSAQDMDTLAMQLMNEHHTTLAIDVYEFVLIAEAEE